jgi:hypothetical protein
MSTVAVIERAHWRGITLILIQIKNTMAVGV